MKNVEVKTAMFLAGINQYEVAEQLGISEYSLCRWLRHELPDDKRVQVLQAIETVKLKNEDR